MGIGSTAPIVSLDMTHEQDALALPIGTSGTRPTGAALSNGEIRYNSTLQSVETYANGTWTSIAGGGALTGSGTGSYDAIWTGTSGLTTGLIYESGGKVGIGTTAPLKALQVNSSTQYQGIRLSNGASVSSVDIVGTSATNDNGEVVLYSGGAQTAILAASGNSYLNGGNVGIGTTMPDAQLSMGSSINTIKIAAYDSSSANLYGMGVNAGQLTFGAGIAANGTPQMVLTNGGNVGIGTTVPVTTLHVYNTSSASSTGQESLRIASLTSGGVIGSGPYLQFASSINVPLAQIAAPAEGSSLNGLAFFTGYNNNLERMRITNSGNVGIGSTSPASDVKADIAGAVKISDTGSETCGAASDVGKMRYNKAAGYFEICAP